MKKARRVGEGHSLTTDSSLAPTNETELFEKALVPKYGHDLELGWFEVEPGKAALDIDAACEVKIISGPGDRVGVAISGDRAKHLTVTMEGGQLKVVDKVAAMSDSDKAYFQDPYSRFVHLYVIAPEQAMLKAHTTGGGRLFADAPLARAELQLEGETYVALENVRELDAKISGKTRGSMPNGGSLHATVTGGDLKLAASGDSWARVNGHFANVDIGATPGGSIDIDVQGELSGTSAINDRGLRKSLIGTSHHGGKTQLSVLLGRWKRETYEPNYCVSD